VTAPALAEQATEDITKVEGDTSVASKPATRGSAHSCHRPHGPDLVVLLPLGLVAEYVIGGRYLLEALFGSVVTGVGIGMELAGQLPVGLGDVLGRGPLVDAKRPVVVLVEPLPLGSHI